MGKAREWFANPCSGRPGWEAPLGKSASGVAVGGARSATHSPLPPPHPHNQSSTGGDWGGLSATFFSGNSWNPWGDVPAGCAGHLAGHREPGISCGGNLACVGCRSLQCAPEGSPRVHSVCRANRSRPLPTSTCYRLADKPVWEQHSQGQQGLPCVALLPEALLEIFFQ